MPDYLIHHGIPGQKWGDRNGPPYPLDKEEHKEVVSRATYSVNKSRLKEEAPYMTNDELEKALKRINLEKRVSELNPSRYDQAMKMLRDFTATVAVVAAAGAAVGTIKKFFNNPASIVK